MQAAVAPPATRAKIVGAFAILYVVWGSTYLAIRVVVEHLPPMLSAGVRFSIAGCLMLVYARWRGHRLPSTWKDYRIAAITGVIMLCGGNGLVSIGEQWINSNLAALFVASSALWMAFFGTFGGQGQSVSRLTIFGLLLGFGGVAVLVGDGLHFGQAPWYAYAALQLSPFLWSLGSVLSKRHPTQCAPIVAAALQTLSAAAVLTTVGLATGEAAHWEWAPRSLWALAYLVVFGSCIAYAAFLWLVHEVPPAQLGTYAYVNPAIAVLLGWWLLDERLAGLQILGTLIILVGVAITTLASARARRVAA